MSLLVTKALYAVSRAKGNARLVEHALAYHATEERVKRGEPALAWPSQNTLAKKCNCSRSTVEKALLELVRLGEIIDTGERKARGTVVWEVLPGVDFLADLTESRSSQKEDGGDLTESRSSGGFPEYDLTDLDVDLTDFGPDLTDSDVDLTDSRRDLTDGSVTNQYEPDKEQEEEPEVEHRSPAFAADGRSPSGLELQKSNRLVAERQEEQNELRRLLDQLPTTQHFDLTKSAVAELCDFLDPDGADMPFEVHATRAMVLA